VTGQLRNPPARPGSIDPSASSRAEALPRATHDATNDFLANVSHELRTPLTAILGYSEMLVSGADGPLNPRQHDDATTILTNGRRLLELIDELIGISRIERDSLELAIQSIEVAPLVSGVVEELQAAAGMKGIKLTNHASDERLILDADESRLRQVLFNLISNAVKFTPRGGAVRVESRLELSSEPDGFCILIDVTDTGIGIRADEHERIFEKFHRIAGPEYPGTGLGLAIARALVNRHGGRLTVESTVGIGSRFSVILPLAHAATPVR
jgi:signal transduction histidine kinase